MGKTLFDKIWDQHVVDQIEGGMDILYIDRHFIHEVTSPQAFDGLRKRNLPVFRQEKTSATADHNVPTIDQDKPIAEPLSRIQVDTLEQNCKEFGIEYYGLGHQKQGIVHLIGPEQGLTKPGCTIVCGDSHTSTHGAFACIAFGIGTSQVEQVLATQCLILQKPKKMRIQVEGQLAPGVYAKDLILYIISQLGTGGATGYFVEYAGSCIESLGMAGRMTVCNMSIEMGARGGMIGADEETFRYMERTSYKNRLVELAEVKKQWKNLHTDVDAKFDRELCFDAADIPPMITYGTNPGQGMGVDAPIPLSKNDPSIQKSLNYMGFEEGKPIVGRAIDYVFIGSCTNSRMEDLQIVTDLVRGKKIAANVRAMVIPGSKLVETQARKAGIDKILMDAGFEFRQPGCSACLGMNEDKVPSGAYCVSTSNRNFEGRQGPGARTILASPATAALAALEGKIVDVRKYLDNGSI
jgi:3-isopropylmalate/(R)-2-methylmalate dehydratase large subunit